MTNATVFTATEFFERQRAGLPTTFKRELTPAELAQIEQDKVDIIKSLRALKKSAEGSTKKATQIKLEGKRVCELFESKKNAYLWVKKSVYKTAGLKATKELKVSGNVDFYIAKYTTKEECFADYAKLQEYCNL